MVDLLDAAAGGGLLGLGGSIVKEGIGYFKDKQTAKIAKESKSLDYAHAKEMAELGLNQEQVTAALQAQATVLAGEYDGLGKSLDDQSVLSGRASQWVVDVLALYRPSITTLLAVGAGAMAWQTEGLRDDIVFMAMTALTWWFGSRQMQNMKR